MGSHAYARLGYGYDLGGSEGGYKFQEYPYDLPWYDELLGMTESAEKALLAAVGFTEDDWTVAGYFEREKAAEKKVPVSLVYYGSNDYSGTLMFVGPHLNQNWVAEVEIPIITDQHRQQLDWALKVLGITPDAGPGWLLATHYG